MMKQVVIFLFTICILSVTFAAPVFAQALTFEPQASMLQAGDEATYSLVLTEGTVTNGVNVDIGFPTTLEVTDFTQADGQFLSLATDCGDDFFVSNQVCFSLVTTNQAFESNQTLGTVTVRGIETAMFSFTVNDESAVVINGEEVSIGDNAVAQEPVVTEPDLIDEPISDDLDAQDDPTVSDPDLTIESPSNEADTDDNNSLMQVAVGAWLISLTFIFGILSFLFRQR